ncbi:hypothetical protein Lal_00001139 [Lupinus albus]|nr:hypothetical protein Lal_00001139 [Lupinus albus]
MFHLKMKETWRLNWLKLYRMVLLLVMLPLFPFSMKQTQCSNLNTEGLALLRMKENVVRESLGALSSWNDEDGVIDPCSWLGVECSYGNVVTFILRNNSFYGDIPKEILQLKELEVLDLGYNNFSGSFPSDYLSSNPSLTILLLDNNDYLDNLSPEEYNLKMISELHVHEKQLFGPTTRQACVSRSSFWHIAEHGDVAQKRQLLEAANAVNTHKTNTVGDKRTVSSSPSPSPSPSSSPFPSSLSPHSEPFSSSESSPSNSPLVSITSSFLPPPLRSPEVSPSPSPYPSNIIFDLSNSRSPLVAPTPDITLSKNPSTVVSAPAPSPIEGSLSNSKRKQHFVIIWSTVGGFSFVLVSVIAFVCFRSSKVVTVKPWATGLSGQLQKAFVTGVPSLKRAELDAACEDFSNIIGSLPDGTVFKGTLSSGVEIAVVSSAVTSSQNWSKNMEAQFRKKIEALSRVNHKNFVNLIGYCEENKPFTRMMVFEYAPNGTLFEHLHIREVEQLDWGMRMRIAMGIAYCLEHLHNLKPPISHRNLLSSSIYLTEDYAAKLSDLSFWNDTVSTNNGSEAKHHLETTSAYIKGNVYSFGVILLELITGKVPYAVDNGFQVDWAEEYINGQPLKELVDKSLVTLKGNEVEKWCEVIKNCVNPDAEKRPTMREVSNKLKEITAMGPDGATPKSSTLWWAELEIIS